MRDGFGSLLMLVLLGVAVFGCGGPESSLPSTSAPPSQSQSEDREETAQATTDGAPDEPSEVEEASPADDAPAFDVARPDRVDPVASEDVGDVTREEPAAPEPESERGPRVELVNKEVRFVKVFYGTNRMRNDVAEGIETTSWDNDRCTPNNFYGSGVAIRSGSEPDQSGLEVGILTVTFPPNRRKGEIQRPTRILSFDLRKEDPDRDVVIANLKSYSHDFDRWAEDLKKTGRNQACIYVHGFANSFATAAHRAAQIAYDLDYDLDEDFQGLTMMYSWPSQNSSSLSAYLTDSEASDTSASAFNQFLDLIKEKAGISRVHVIAHSMGNRLVAEASTLRGTPEPLLDQLVLAAPDVWATAFRNEYQRSLSGFADWVTLYVSDNDRALQASSQLLRGSEPRVGQATGGLLAEKLADNFDAIDATTLASDFLGHSYYAENKSMLSDIHELLKGNAAEDRLLIEHHPRWPSWRFRALDSSPRSKWGTLLSTGGTALVLALIVLLALLVMSRWRRSNQV